MAGLSHVDRRGKARMVDVGAKAVTRREAEASAFIKLGPETLRLVRANRLAKGDVLNTARLAGIQAAKRTFELIPLTHPLPLDSVAVDMDVEKTGIRVRCRVAVEARTGAEMEALTGAAVAALTVYDMVKAVERGAEVVRLRLDYKSGGKSGVFRRRS
ncbi:MAG TPA: cyclic pyranopterin monophosphate synthase MoaC [Candidatus Aminicenantes bacterium]|nr:cyclic pyranopterin monophosphate synthase MoaC [Candidatus Aminicenantes bacterium]HRY64613.1 cyclic pyranopterin monophosphate synthase MoaC [Candidatus Aminicenantes bacterium]HRZ71526.1 cyclic pyranopterin monophosphate synthase MoaC [Candidatus Aminicenantes bacterium]